jgi:Na+/H+-dicarboxylate symporter
LSLRALEIIGLTAGAIGGYFLPTGIIAGEPSRLLVTFLGIVSASILPTISLLVGSMAAGGRSVQGLDRLNRQLRRAMMALFTVFAAVGVAILFLLALTVPTPAALDRLPITLTHLPNHLGQGAAVAACIFVLMRARFIPGILLTALTIRHEIAADDARKKLMEKSPSQEELQRMFANHPDFGKSIGVVKPSASNPH